VGGALGPGGIRKILNGAGGGGKLREYTGDGKVPLKKKSVLPRKRHRRHGKKGRRGIAYAKVKGGKEKDMLKLSQAGTCAPRSNLTEGTSKGRG